MPPRRGRAPVKCTPEHPCRLNGEIAYGPEDAKAPRKRTPKETRTRVAAEINRQKAPESPVEETDPREASLTKALEAKGLLEAVGWTVRGTPYNSNGVRVHAVRGDERLVIILEDGRVTSQDYSLWPAQIADIGKPESKLPFDPEEASDREVVAHLNGMPVKWWSQLRQAEESAIIGTGRIKIERLFEGSSEQSNGSRIISFIDHGGGGFRSFRLNALTKVG